MQMVGVAAVNAYWKYVRLEQRRRERPRTRGSEPGDPGSSAHTSTPLVDPAGLNSVRLGDINAHGNFGRPVRQARPRGFEAAMKKKEEKR